MNPFLVISPTKDICDQIFELRNQIIGKELGDIDPRKKVIPHITITYIEEELTKNNINDLLKSLDSFVVPKTLFVNIKEIVNWDRKIVALFNPLELSQIVDGYRKIFDDLSIKVNSNYENLYGKTIGDHMKIAREIKLENIDGGLNLVKSVLPQQIPLNTISFIGYDCEEKDILWKKNLLS